jgi:dTDP-glucose pyrophosphorylase
MIKNLVLPMAGSGKRFKKYNFKTIKPLILVDKECILEKSLKYLPKIKKKYLLVNKKILDNSRIIKKIANKNKITLFSLNKKTKGQADTVNKLEKIIQNNEDALIHSCDYILSFDIRKFSKLKKICDVVIFVSKLHNQIIKDYNAFAYCKIDKNQNVKKIVEKKIISNKPELDHVVTGSFWFKKVSNCFLSQKISEKEGNKINNEYYVANNINNLIKLGLKIKILEVKNWINLGDYFSLNHYIYWQNFFKNNEKLKKC